MISYIKIFADKITSFSRRRVELAGAPYIAYGIFGIVNFPLTYILFQYATPQVYTNIGLRIIATLMCFLLVVKNYWPKILQRYLPIYWHLTVLFTIPFFGTYLLFKNHISGSWLMNVVLGLFLFVLVVDWISFITLLSLGIFLGWLFYAITTGPIYIASQTSIYLALNILIFTVIIGTFFSRNKEELQKEKLKTTRMVAASMVHELHTPLQAIKCNASCLSKYLPDLISAYRKAKNTKLDIPAVAPSHFKEINHALTHIQSEIESAHTFLNMLMVKASQTHTPAKQLDICSIHDCIALALHRYPLSVKAKKLINWKEQPDFHFRGQRVLIVHVLYNLLRNALYYIKLADKGSISIWQEKGDKINRLHFKDTGTGIPAKVQPLIFNHFFSSSEHGTGIGLAFCKMVLENFGGSMICNSEEGEFTEFILSFPVIKDITTKENHGRL